MKIAYCLRQRREQIECWWQSLWRRRSQEQKRKGRTPPQAAKPGSAAEEVQLEQMGKRFFQFCQRYGPHFQGSTRCVSRQAWQYLQGLLHSLKRNIERMVEKIPEADYQAQQHFVTYSPWRYEAVLSQVAAEADQLLGGDQDSGLILDESGFPKQGKKIGGGGSAMVWQPGQGGQLPGGGLCGPLLSGGSHPH